MENCKEAIIILWQHRLSIFPLLLTFIVISSLINLLGDWLLPQGHSLSNNKWHEIILWIPGGLVFTVFAVSCHRIFLLGETPVNKFGIIPWTIREAKFFGLLLLLSSGMYLLSLLLIKYSEFIISQRFFYFQELSSTITLPFSFLMSFSMFFLSFFIFYFLARSSLVFPATAIDIHPTYKSIGKLSKGNGWRLALLIFGMPAIFFRLIFEINLSVENLLLIFEHFVPLLYYGWLPIEIALLSLNFRFFSEMEVPKESEGI